MSKLRFALVGCGSIAKKHAHVLNQYLDDAEIGAFVDLNRARAEEFSAKYGAPAFASVPGGLEGFESFEESPAPRAAPSEPPKAAPFLSSESVSRGRLGARTREGRLGYGVSFEPPIIFHARSCRELRGLG